MNDNSKYIQAQPFKLAGGGISATDVNITLKSFKTPDGVNITTADIGSKMTATLEPGASKMEVISLAGATVTQNADGTATISGVTRGLKFKGDYSADTTLRKSHGGGTTMILTNNPQMYDGFTNKNNDETIVETWTFPSGAKRPVLDADIDTANTAALVTFGQLARQAIAGAANASTTVKGLVEEATQAEVDAKTQTGGTGAELFVNPTTLRSTLLSDYKADTGAANAYVITPSPAITAYAAGQVFSFKATNANTTASTLNVNGLGVKTIKKFDGLTDLSSGDIAVGQIVVVEYDGTNFQMINCPANALALANNASYVAGEAITAGQPLHYTAYSQAGNEIKLDTSANGNISSGASLSFNVTVASNSNRVLIVDIHDYNSTVTSVTYNGVAMTLVQSQINAVGTYLHQYSLVAPATGTNSLVITRSASPNNCVAIATSYYNVNQATPVEATAKAAPGVNVTSGTSSITSISGVAMVHAATTSFNGSTNSGASFTFSSTSGQNIVSVMPLNTFTIAKANSLIVQTAQAISTAYGWGITGASLAVDICQLVLKPATSASNGVVKASAAASNALQEAKQNYVGNALQTVAAGASVNIQTFGVDTNQSGLTIGKYYYLQDTAGTIGLSAGTVSKIVLKSTTATAGVIIP